MALNPQTHGPFVTTIDFKLADKLLGDLRKQHFIITHPSYTYFCAKKQGISCTLYQSGKLVVQGKEIASFIEFYLEPEILKSFLFTHPLINIDTSPHIGIDESGKGDFFGPLCIAGVYASHEQFKELHRIGVKDSKTISDTTINEIAPKIKSQFIHHIVRINPFKYNQIYQDFKNLNRLLAWGHATTIENLIQRTQCPDVLIDQFADESVVKLALKKKGLTINLSQRHRAEEDLVVAAASILARHAFLEGLENLSSEIGIPLPKGASAVTIKTGKKIFHTLGYEGLLHVCKQHFKTWTAITN